jgi:hypothetical protein
MRFFLFSVSVVAIFHVPVFARGDDSPSALDELKQGYALKQSGHCAEAMPHFVASFRADPQPKALLNLADCEQQLRDLLSARGHATRGRELADQEHDAELVGVADEQLAAIDRRLPRLTLTIAAEAPADTTISLDGKPLAPEARATPMVLNPGPHEVVVAAPGHRDRRYEVVVDEGAHQQLVVAPGDFLAVPAQPAPTVAPSPSLGPSLAADGAFGVGAVGFVVGVATGLAAVSKHGTLAAECGSDGRQCPSAAQDEIDSFRSLRTWSTVGYAVGALGVVAGAVLWAIEPRKRSEHFATQVSFGPTPAGIGASF